MKLPGKPEAQSGFSKTRLFLVAEFFMGAEFWEELAPWNPDPGIALRELQARFLADHVDFPNEVRESLRNAKETVRFTREQGDEYNVLSIYQADLAYLEDVVSRPLPTDPQERLDIPRRIQASGGQGLGNILDIESVCDAAEFGDEGWPLVSHPLPDDDLLVAFGSTTPTIEQAKKAGLKFARRLGRGESVCFKVYDESRQPVGWWFAECTID